MSTHWTPAAVFVCSTFLDMQHERDYLRDVVFPELAEQLRSQQRYLEAVDLRWGVDTLPLQGEQEKELLVLRVCLAEIERTRPFFIALIGDRYGWRPDAGRLQEAAEEAGFTGDLADKSVTALEIEYGVLHDPARLSRCHFFLRDPLPRDEMTDERQAQYFEEDPAAVAELRVLKRRIVQLVPEERVHRYRAEWDAQRQTISDLEQLRELVLGCVAQDLREEGRERQARLEAEARDAERWALDEFLASHRRDFCGRQGLVRELATELMSPTAADAPKGVCLTGEAGAGKSAVLARLQRVFPRLGALVLIHAAGMSGAASSVDSMLRRWCADLAVATGAVAPPPEAPARDLEAAFGDLLRRAAQSTRVV
ncbi:MAG: DUF4062 domain-containing protein, partial [Armatimonadetes bacterium]|nr:DUF4062 domain-containing protein [Armatimonadota bacterium]